MLLWKFAAIGFTQALAQELAPHRITVNAICPALVDTERVDDIAVAAPPSVSRIRIPARSTFASLPPPLPWGRIPRSPRTSLTQPSHLYRDSPYFPGSVSFFSHYVRVGGLSTPGLDWMHDLLGYVELTVKF